MRIKCQFNRNSDVPAPARVNKDFSSAIYNVVIGREYVVYGQSIFDEVLYYLIDPNEEARPSWFPANLFSISNHLLPVEWYFCFNPEERAGGLSAIWGYRELVQEESHYEMLIERDRAALLTFRRYLEKLREN